MNDAALTAMAPHATEEDAADAKRLEGELAAVVARLHGELPAEDAAVADAADAAALVAVRKVAERLKRICDAAGVAVPDRWAEISKTVEASALPKPPPPASS